MKLKDQELKAKWIAALRSGKYKQGKDLLRLADDSYCCLGVFCDILGRGKWNPSSRFNGFTFEYDDRLTPQSTACLTTPILEDHFSSTKLDSHNELILARMIPITLDAEDVEKLKHFYERKEAFKAGESVTLSLLNDLEIPFKSIADLIEKYL